jgi:hypothetical protein
MPSVTSNLMWGRTLGVYLAEGRLTLTELASTPSGRKVLSLTRLPVGAGGPGRTLKEWLVGRLKRRQRRNLSVCIGLAAEQTFFTTRTVAHTSNESPTAASLLSAGGGASLDPATSAADFIKSKLRRTTVYRIAACRRSLAEEFQEALREAGVQAMRLEPAPSCVLDAADRSARPPRAWKTVLRVLLGEGGGVAILAAGGKPLLWRRFALTAGQEAMSIASAARNLEVHARGSLGVTDVAGLFVQGKIEAGVADTLKSLMSTEVQVAPGEPLDDATYSLAMALSARRREQEHLDLFRPIYPPPSLAKMFPHQLAAGMLLAAAIAGGVLWNALTEAQDEYASLLAKNGSFAWAVEMKTEAIKTERKGLSDEVASVQQFLGTRAVWSNYLRDLPTRMPANSCLQSIVGSYELKLSSKTATRQANKSLIITGMAPYPDGGSVPKEIDALLDSLRSADLLRKAFPNVNLAEVKQRRDAGLNIAVFTIVATPNEKGKGEAKEENDRAGGGKEKAPAQG